MKRKPTTFNVTYEIITQENAEQGDADERGFIAEAATLRDAVELVQQTRTCHVDNGMEYLTGAHESRSLHIPDHVTMSTRARIERLVRG